MARFLLDKREVVYGGGFHDQVYYDYWKRWHYAVDYVADNNPIYAPTDIKITREYWGNEGGHWLDYSAPGGYTFRLAHLKEYKHGIGDVKEGTLIAISDNTGSRTTGPHLHVECRLNNVLFDPEIYFTNLLKPMSYNDKIIRNQTTGEFALVVNNKKFIIPNEPGTLALITFLQREDKRILESEIVNVTADIWKSIITSKDLSFK